MWSKAPDGWLFLIDFPRGNEAAKVFVEEIVMEYVESN